MWAVVADADAVARQRTEEVLVRAGFLVIGCKDARQLMTAARRFRPSLVVLDLDGTESFEEVEACLRLRGEGLSPAVIVASADVQRSRVSALPRAWRTLAKPFSPETLLGLALWAWHGAD